MYLYVHVSVMMCIAYMRCGVHICTYMRGETGGGMGGGGGGGL